ncbi:hypothetical protein [Streptomyces sp. NPDC008137]|uniref:hypothetical protein n=1 Tax=Streptomyces sp. NPDC008137 TaxID=3364813 RepID=UPI0036EC4819
MASDEPSVSINRADNSAFAFGRHGNATTNNVVQGSRDESAEELLQAVREVRGDLQRMRESEQRARLDEALAETEDEINRTGSAGAGRLQRLREVLGDTETVLSAFASAGALAVLLGM